MRLAPDEVARSGVLHDRPFQSRRDAQIARAFRQELLRYDHGTERRGAVNALAIEYHWLMRIAYLLCGTTISYLCADWTAESLSLTSHVVAAIINGVTCILLLNGMIERARSGKLLTSLIDTLRNGRK